MNIQDIINNIAEGDNLAAKEGLEHVLSAKAFDALQGYKQEIAATLYGGQEQESEEDTDYEEDEEVAYAESVEHDEDQDQLDEVSLKLASKAYRNRKVDAYQGGNNRPFNSDTDKAEKAEKTADRIKKKFGSAGETRVKRLNSLGLAEDGEPLDEVSMKLASSVYKNRKLDAEDDSAGHSSGSGQKRSDSYTKSGKHKMNISRDKIMSKPGGAQRVRRIDAITEEGEHLDEVSLDAAAKVYKKRADNAYSNQSNSNVDKQVKSREVIGKRFGLKGKQMAKGIEKKYDNYSQ